jgi:hypothetical protein
MRMENGESNGNKTADTSLVSTRTNIFDSLHEVMCLPHKLQLTSVKAE